MHNVSKEIFFTAQLPDAAFISNFSMKIDEKIIFGDVKEKQKAKQDYDTAVKAGKSAGLVAEKYAKYVSNIKCVHFFLLI